MSKKIFKLINKRLYQIRVSEEEFNSLEVTKITKDLGYIYEFSDDITIELSHRNDIKCLLTPLPLQIDSATLQLAHQIDKKLNNQPQLELDGNQLPKTMCDIDRDVSINRLKYYYKKQKTVLDILFEESDLINSSTIESFFDRHWLEIKGVVKDINNLEGDGFASLPIEMIGEICSYLP